jgi:hypothetical protein
METDRIVVASPLSGFRIEVVSRFGQRIEAVSPPARQVDVQSPVVTMIRVASALSVEALQ